MKWGREVEAAMTLQRIRVRVAERYGLTVPEMRELVLAREEWDRDKLGLKNVGRPMRPTVHRLRGGRACPGC